MTLLRRDRVNTMDTARQEASFQRILRLADIALVQLEILGELIEKNGKWLEENCKPILKDQSQGRRTPRR